MDSQTESELINQARQHIANRTTSQQGQEVQADASRYLCPRRFQQEQQKLFNTMPALLLHCSELSQPHSYQAVSSPLGELLVSRDAQGIVHVFYNSCRHRGAQIAKGKGCSKMFVCPYHAWSYGSDGKLKVVPGQAQCFPNLDKEQNGLVSLACVEKYGFIWACPASEPQQAESDLDQHLGDMKAHLHWLEADSLARFKRSSETWLGNWKLFVEGGLETYHFSFAHKDTIAPYFFNNVAVIDQLGQHFRVVMPTRELTTPEQSHEPAPSLHNVSHTLFLLMPNAALLIQKAHVDLIQFRPVAVDKTEIAITTLVPADADLSDPEQQAHWAKNHQITNTTLNEDWELGQSIQASLASGGLDHIQYGTNEWALAAFNREVNKVLDKAE